VFSCGACLCSLLHLWFCCVCMCVLFLFLCIRCFALLVFMFHVLAFLCLCELTFPWVLVVSASLSCMFGLCAFRCFVCSVCLCA